MPVHLYRRFVGMQHSMRMSDEVALEAACATISWDCITGEPSVIAMKAGTVLA